MITEQETSRSIRVGAVVAASQAVLMVFLFFIGAEQKIFSRKNEYRLRIGNVSGLAEGNPVQLAGVRIGSVKEIQLPENPASQAVDITISVDEKYEGRIRQDSQARVRKLGLIASDSYIEISPGSPQQAILPPGSVIPSARGTDVDKLLASGEDLVTNFLQISYSLRNVLARVDRGEGVLGELTTDRPGEPGLSASLQSTLNRTNAILTEVESGRGVLGRLIYDDRMGTELTGSLRASAKALETITTSIERGEGALGALLTDPQGKERVDRLVENLALTSENLAAFSQSITTGEGLLPRLLNDREYGDETLREFQLLVSRLGETARKLNEGEGTAGRLISDPSVYEAINDIVIGINESKLLRWFIRDRQQKGIETRYKAAQQSQPQPQPPVVQPAASDGDSAPPAQPPSSPPQP
jgi:phospholipid/cholesterol/gamma-HCH transport system substrate-binding protein